MKAESKIAALENEITDLTQKRDRELEIIEEASRIALAKQQQNIEQAKSIAVKQLNKIAEEGVALKRANEDFVRSLQVEPTKTFKTFTGREKPVAKTPEEIQRDKEVKAAQAVLKDKDEIAKGKDELAAQMKLVQKEREEIQADRADMQDYLAGREKELMTQAITQAEKEVQSRLGKIEEERKLERAEFEQGKAELAQQLKATKDAQYAATVQREVYALSCVPLPTAAEVMARNYEREQQRTKGAHKQWQR